MPSRTSSPRWQFCNVYQSVAPVSRLWRFNVDGEDVKLSSQQEFAQDLPLPPKTAQRGWLDLWQPRLNVAWLPADQVYIRVVHLPKGEPEELRPMLELQLERLSPAPVNQVVWTYQPVAHPVPEQQSAIVIIVERSKVEAYLDGLELKGYLADRLELPWLHHVLSGPRPSHQTSVYIIRREQMVFCLAAWWYDRTLQHIDLFQLEDSEAVASRIADHLVQVAWTGEIEGWLDWPPRWRLTALPDELESWSTGLRARLGGDFETQAAPEWLELAQLAARRGIRGESTANLLPEEHVARYRQQFIDRLWMRGLGVLFLVYLFLVVLYFAGVQVFEHQDNQLRAELAGLSGAYTNALELRERVRIFAEQAELRFAALNSLRVAAELLPPEITLTRFTFQGGRSLRLTGTVALDQQALVTEYRADLLNATIDGTPLFDRQKFEAPTIVAQGGVARWDFTADLNRVFAE